MQALAEANALVRRQFGDDKPTSVSLEELMRGILSPHGYAKSTVSGPAFPVGERATNNVALIFHELATNAVKYGALSSPNGSIAVEWSLDVKDLKLTWKEAGGPPPKPPNAIGFGSRLVAATIEGAGGSLHCDWEPTGLRATVRMPLQALKL
jgi:two-component sensor histidine kinase